MIVFVYPPNEPPGSAELVGMEIEQSGFGRSILSHHNNVDEVIGFCSRIGTVVCFFGGTTQLSWLFDTDDKVSRWLSLVRKPRVLISTELVFGDHSWSSVFQARCFQSVKVATHLVLVREAGAASPDVERLAKCGLPIMEIESLPFAFSFFRSFKPFSQREKKFLFFGSLHGGQRKAMIPALQSSGVLDVKEIPISNPSLAVAAYNDYAGVVSLRSYHDRIVKYLPRFLEATSCGCYVLDLQKLEANQTGEAVKVAMSVDWGQAEMVVESRRLDLLKFSVWNFCQKVKLLI